MVLKNSEHVLRGHSVDLIECFNTWQGEGPDNGKNMLLMRFKYCNRKCCFCDTAVKMRCSVEGSYTLEQIQTTLDRTKAGILLTGGEPTATDKQFEQSVKILNLLKYPIANVESNGYALKELMQQVAGSQPVNFIFSPKTENKTDAYAAWEVAHTLLAEYPHNFYVKFLYCNTEVDDKFLERIYETANEYNCHQNIYLMPLGATREELLSNAPRVFDVCEKYHFNFSSRTHVLFNFV
jgi:organic radical activating enzyme